MISFGYYSDEAYQLKINRERDFNIVKAILMTYGADDISDLAVNHLFDPNIPLATINHLKDTFATKPNLSIQNFDDTFFNHSLHFLIIFYSQSTFFSYLSP